MKSKVTPMTIRAMAAAAAADYIMAVASAIAALIVF